MTTLLERRIEASQRTGGASDDAIKKFVLKMLAEHHPKGGSLLDYGSGRGELLGIIHKQRTFESLMGIDLYKRPDDLPADIEWHQQDLNESIVEEKAFDVVICSEVIEHLENPRHVFRSLGQLTKPGGLLILTIPNQESIRSYIALLFGGHFVDFLGDCYPAHITALLRLDFIRMCAETGFSIPKFYFSGSGGIPKRPTLKWQKVSFGLLKGRLFSDHLGLVARKSLEA